MWRYASSQRVRLSGVAVCSSSACEILGLPLSALPSSVDPSALALALEEKDFN